MDTKRRIDVVNLDPAAEYFDYNPLIDIRDLINVKDTMEDEELHFGPNGGLIFCVEFLMENAEWLRENLGTNSLPSTHTSSSSNLPFFVSGEQEDDYILFDCPGQIELYTHLTSVRKLVGLLQSWNFNICCVFLLDVQFMTDGAKFLSGTMSALSVMVNLELPHINLLSKMDLLSKGAKKRLGRFLEPDSHALLGDIELNHSRFNAKYEKLSEAIGKLIEDYSLVRFYPLNLKDEENVGNIMITVDSILQYGEDADVKVQDFGENDDGDG